MAFNLVGSEVLDVVYNTGAMYQFDSAGTHFLSNNVYSPGVAFNLFGSEVLDVVYNTGALYQFDSAGTHWLSS